LVYFSRFGVSTTVKNLATLTNEAFFLLMTELAAGKAKVVLVFPFSTYPRQGCLIFLGT
jgi:hypothetical protein